MVLTESGARELGVELQARGHSGSNTLSAGSFFGLSDIDATTGDRILPSPPDSGATIAILSPGDLSAILHALETHDNGRIISRPRLLANANEEATFKSIHEEPTTTINAITASTSTTSFGQYLAAGTTLTIKPTVLAGDYVYLDIALNLSSFSGTPASSEVPPPRDTNDITTGVSVPDQADHHHRRHRARRGQRPTSARSPSWAIYRCWAPCSATRGRPPRTTRSTPSSARASSARLTSPT